MQGDAIAMGIVFTADDVQHDEKVYNKFHERRPHVWHREHELILKVHKGGTVIMPQSVLFNVGKLYLCMAVYDSGLRTGL